MLVNCPHCGHPVASTSPTCPHCGGLNDIFMDAVEVHDNRVDYIAGNQDKIQNGNEFFEYLFNRLLWNFMIYFMIFSVLALGSPTAAQTSFLYMLFLTIWFTGYQLIFGTGFLTTYGYILVSGTVAVIVCQLIGFSEENAKILIGFLLFVVPFVYTIVQIGIAAYGIITGKINLKNFHLSSADVYINRVRNFGKYLSTKNEDQQRQSIINDARAETGYRPEYFE